jgi:hypothetical protein
MSHHDREQRFLRPTTPIPKLHIASTGGWERPVHRLAIYFTLLRVPYAAIGGVAMAAYVQGRLPDDLDIVVGGGPAAATKAARAFRLTLMSFGLLDPRQIEPSPDQIQAGLEGIAQSRYGNLHIIGNSLPSGSERSLVVRNRHWCLFGGIPVAVAAPEELLRIKTNTGRAGDKVDATSLSARFERGN